MKQVSSQCIERVVHKDGLAVVRAYVNDKWSIEKIRREFHYGRRTVLAILSRCGVRLTARECYNGKTIIDPTEEEIAELTTEIRSTWSEREEEARRVGYKKEPYEFQVIHLQGFK